MSDSAIIDDMSADNLSITDTPSPDALNDQSSGTPDASNSNGSANGSSSSASRRPPRKSTLTQQQKNQKRQRATQEQLVTLEHEFAKNSTPTAATRERIASEIQMTERSVQIWFQNSRRRAKIKMMAKKGLDGGDDLDRMPEPMRYLAMQAMHEGRPIPPHLMTRPGQPVSYGSGNMFMGGDVNNSGKVVIHHFTCRSLSIGSWRRVGQNAMDLVVFYSPDKACITYYINNDSAGYKIEFPFAFIKDITLESGDSQPPTNGAQPRPGGLIIQLTRPPNFFMDSSGQGGFYQCGDFTEDQQASQILTHHLGGHPKVLSGQLAKLVSLESYQNRHSPFDLHAMPASAPVSPSMGIPRPASQPNVHFARPHPPHMNSYHDQGFPGHVGLHPGRMQHGHKRQRSRSVPIAIDFSMLHGPMPTFNIQQPSPLEYNPPQTQFFHPMPQHPGQPLGPNLQIDTSAGVGYAMDMRQMPMSATATTPSEFASPGFYPSHPQHSQMPQTAADFNTPMGGPFLSPSPMGNPSHMIPQSHTPLSHTSHGEPHIADNSPPLDIHRSASADMFGTEQDHHQSFSDGCLMLSEMYSKQSLNMPMPSPVFDETGMLSLHEMAEFHTPRDHLDLPMTPFATIDPNTLGVSH